MARGAGSAGDASGRVDPRGALRGRRASPRRPHAHLRREHAAPRRRSARCRGLLGPRRTRDVERGRWRSAGRRRAGHRLHRRVRSAVLHEEVRARGAHRPPRKPPPRGGVLRDHDGRDPVGTDAVSPPLVAQARRAAARRAGRSPRGARAPRVVARAPALPHLGPRRQRRPHAHDGLGLGDSVSDHRPQERRAVALPRRHDALRARQAAGVSCRPSTRRDDGRRPVGGDRCGEARRPGVPARDLLSLGGAVGRGGPPDAHGLLQVALAVDGEPHQGATLPRLRSQPHARWR